MAASTIRRAGRTDMATGCFQYLAASSPAAFRFGLHQRGRFRRTDRDCIPCARFRIATDDFFRRVVNFGIKSADVITDIFADTTNGHVTIRTETVQHGSGSGTANASIADEVAANSANSVRSD